MIRYNTVKTAGKSLTPPPVDYGKAFNKGLAQSGLFEYLEKQALRKEEIKKENEIKDAQIAQAVGNLREGATVSKMSDFMRAKSGEFVMSKKNELAAVRSQMLNMKNKNSQEYFDLQNQEQKIKSAVANFNDGLERNRQARTLTLKALNPDDNTDDGADISNTLNNRFSKDYYMMFETEEGQKYLEENFTIDNNTGEWYIAGMEYKGKPISGSNLPTTDLKSYTKEKALDDAFSKYITRVGKGTSINSGFTNDYKTTVNNILSGMTMEELQSQLVDDFENEGGTPRYFGIEEVQAAKEEIDKGGVPPSVFEIEVNGEMKSFNAWEIYSNKNNAKMFLNNKRNEDAEVAMQKQIDANQKVIDEGKPKKKGLDFSVPLDTVSGIRKSSMERGMLGPTLLPGSDTLNLKKFVQRLQDEYNTGTTYISTLDETIRFKFDQQLKNKQSDYAIAYAEADTEEKKMEIENEFRKDFKERYPDAKFFSIRSGRLSPFNKDINNDNDIVDFLYSRNILNKAALYR
tara:strand:- start:4259 stop:5806 length:1548 start_codon:yes stop_codon:yes gene_type:complete